MNDNKGELPSLPAAVKPGDYPLRSVASRAAAKMVAKVKRESAQVIRVQIRIMGASIDPSKPKPTPTRSKCADGSIIEIVALPYCDPDGRLM